MTSLTHEQAREYIQQGQHEDLPALRQHLATCDECRAYATMHAYLLRELPVRNARAHPTIEQRAAILASAGNGLGLPRFWRPLVSAGGVAAMIFLATAFWLVMSAAYPSAARPPLPGPWATLLAPVLPSPTAHATQPAPTPTPAGTPDPRGRYVIDTVPAPSLAGNLIGEPLEQQVIVYLPPSYDTSDRRYPVVYALFYTFNRDEFQFNEFGTLARSGMNIALKNGMTQEMILVVPDSINALNLLNHFVSSPVVGDWESFLGRDLVAHIDANYRTLPEVGSRGLLGQSHLAPAALATAERYPDVFSAVYLSEPWVISPAGIEQSPFFSAVARIKVLELQERLASLTLQEARKLLADGDTNLFPRQAVLWWTVSYGVAYAPTDGATPPYFKYPFSGTDGPADPEIWQIWEQSLGQVPERIQANLYALRALDIAISHPEGVSEPALLTPDGPSYLSEQLTAAGISHRYHVQDKAILVEVGEDALPFFAEVFADE